MTRWERSRQKLRMRWRKLNMSERRSSMMLSWGIGVTSSKKWIRSLQDIRKKDIVMIVITIQSLLKISVTLISLMIKDQEVRTDQEEKNTTESGTNLNIPINFTCLKAPLGIMRIAEWEVITKILDQWVAQIQYNCIIMFIGKIKCTRMLQVRIEI